MPCHCADGRYDNTHSHFGMGAIRCAACSDRFTSQWQREKREHEARLMADHLTANHEDGHICPDCCVHNEYDHGICLDCGKDCTDFLIMRAEDYYEGER